MLNFNFFYVYNFVYHQPKDKFDRKKATAFKVSSFSHLNN